MRMRTNGTPTLQSGTRCLFAAMIPACILISALSGCGGDGFDRMPISGTVTYNGKPIPKGALWFEPDSSLGNLAPTGFAKIEDGNYRTTPDESPLAGPHTVRIQGYDGTAPTADDAREMLPEQVFLGRPLFPEFTRAVQLSKETPTLNIDVGAP